MHCSARSIVGEFGSSSIVGVEFFPSGVSYLTAAAGVGVPSLPPRPSALLRPCGRLSVDGANDGTLGISDYGELRERSRHGSICQPEISGIVGYDALVKVDVL